MCGLSLVSVHGLLVAVVSLVAEHGLWARRLQQLWHVDSVVAASRLWSTESIAVVHGLSCSAVCGILLDRGLNPCLLH